jgi:hypothetical protein
LRGDFTETVRDHLFAKPHLDDTADWVGDLTDVCMDLVVASLLARPLPVGRLRSVVVRLLGEKARPSRAVLVPRVVFAATAAMWDEVLDLACELFVEGDGDGDPLLMVIGHSLQRCVDAMEEVVEVPGG